MLSLTFKNLFANKIRFALTMFAVVLGVAFAVTAFTLSDTLGKAFDGIAETIAEPVDVAVRAQGGFNNGTVPNELLEELRSIDGVAAADGLYGGDPALCCDVVSADGENLSGGGFGPPLIGQSLDPDPAKQVTSFNLVDGTWPTQGEAGVDIDFAEDKDISIGDVLTVKGKLGDAGTVDLTVSATLKLGDDNGAGASYVTFSPADGANIMGLDGFQAIWVRAEDGVTETELAERIVGSDPRIVNYDADSDLAGAGVLEGLTGQQLEDEFADEFAQFATAIQWGLLGFAVLALFVAALLISNTFAMVISQRIRELALLRAVGATGRQVAQSVMIEGLLIGLIASILGYGVGLALSTFFKALLDRADALPTGALVIAPRTFVVALFIGVIVTFLASILPAIRATRVPPVAAMREGFSLRSDSRGIVRTVGGGLVAVLAVLMLAVGFAADAGDGLAAKLGPLGIGAVLSFVAVAALSPIFAGPLARVLGAPLRFLGTSGKLAQQNAARSPRRTASTASALMVGLALITLAAVVGASIQDRVNTAFREAVKGDYFAVGSNGPGGGVTGSVYQALSTSDSVDSVSRFRSSFLTTNPEVRAVVNGEEIVKNPTITAVDGADIADLVDPFFIEGGTDGLADDGLLLFKDPASDLEVSVGDQVTFQFPTTGQRTLTVRGIYDDATILDNWVVDISTYEQVFSETVQLDFFVMSKLAEGVDASNPPDDLAAIAAENPSISFLDSQGFLERQQEQINFVLIALNILLGLAVLIAFLGIVNTLALSVFERTREIGLMRAVGMRRRQVAQMIGGESVVVTLFGTVLGVALGMVLGFGLAQSLPASVVTNVVVPWGTIIASFVVAILAGLLASVIPAFRAVRLDVLDAISTGT